MQLTQFNAYCPFEVGDRILDTAGQVHTITDIACVHYARGGNVEFRFELDHSGYYAPITAQDPPRNEHDGKRVKILICDESSQLPPEFKEFIKKRFG